MHINCVQEVGRCDARLVPSEWGHSITMQPCASFWASKLRPFPERYLLEQEALSTVHGQQ